MNKPKTTLIIILILLGGNIFLGIKHISLVKELRQTKEAALETQTINDKVLEFTKLFISEVLKAEKEVGFEERLRLETAVRNIGDEEILNQWKKFVDSKTEADAQTEVKNLLEVLVNKLRK